MKHTALIPFFLVTLLLSGCSTTQEVFMAKTSPIKTIRSVAQVPDDGNSNSMNIHLQSALVQQGLNVKASLPAGTRKARDVDALVSYVDVWRWDLVMYLQSISVKMFDAETGDLLVTGQWKDSALHGFRDAEMVVKGLVAEMLGKLRGTTVETGNDGRELRAAN